MRLIKLLTLFSFLMAVPFCAAAWVATVDNIEFRRLKHAREMEESVVV